MKCESCKIAPVDNTVVIENDKHYPFRLCSPCRHRLVHMALRPLEFYNLMAIHGGYSVYLHDDFYNFDTGEATQSDIKVLNAKNFPFPTFNQVKNDLNKLIDYTFVHFWNQEFIITEFNKFDKLEILNAVDEKLRYNRGISSRAYWLVGLTVGSVAENWVRMEWQTHCNNEYWVELTHPVARCLPFEEGFALITSKIEELDEKTFFSTFLALGNFESVRALDFIEKHCHRIGNISDNWGRLAARSQFSWERADKWLTIGRPLSLIALDALYFITSKNQIYPYQKHPGPLIGDPGPAVIAKRLDEYLTVDHVPRTKNITKGIINNIFSI